MAPSKKTVTVVSPVVPAPAELEVVPDDVVDTSSVVVVDDSVGADVAGVDVSGVDRYDSVIEKLQTMVNEAKEIINVVRNLKKENAKLVRIKSKRQRKTMTGESTKRPASGITKPTKLSEDLCDFLGVARGTSLARTEVTKIINTYIKNNKLQDESDKRTIHPDEKLLKILMPIPSDKKLSFFNMQSYIKHQFIKE
jgi:chromatin remodeling complex protein RSC6